MMTPRLLWLLPLLAQPACAGHRYAVSDEVAASRNDRQWRVVGEPPPEPAAVATPAPPVTDSPASAEPPAALDGAAPSQATFPEADAAPSPTGGASSATDDATETQTTASESSEAPAPAEPAPPASPPPLPVAHVRVDLAKENDAWEPTPERPKLQRMVWGLTLRFGGTFASEDLLVVSYTDGSTETLTTGGGVNFFFGTAVTPFNVGRHSLGFGFEGGWKVGSIGQGSDTDISFSRKAFMPRVQYGYALTPTIQWITAAGPQYETDVTLKASGGLVGNAKFDDAWGYFGETGLLLDIGYFGLDLTLRHTRIDYAVPDGPSVSGNSFGVFCSLQIGLLKTENLVPGSGAYR